MLFGPFGDLYRRDKRTPCHGEAYADINPNDAAELGLEDGDYVWIDADPEDRPYRGWQGDQPTDIGLAADAAGAHVPWHAAGRHPHLVQHVRRDARPRSRRSGPDRWPRRPRAPTGYQAMFRYGSHQSATRGWLKPTLDDRLAGAQGHLRPEDRRRLRADVHCPGAPREAIVKIIKAEPAASTGRACGARRARPPPDLRESRR